MTTPTGTPAPIPPKLHFVLIDGAVWVAPYPYAEYSQCTAQTAKRKRCRQPLDSGQVSGWTWLNVSGGRVNGYDFDDRANRMTKHGRRYLAQRCELHFDNGTPAAVDSEWRRFDPVADAEHVKPLHPVDAWAALTEDQRATVRVAAPALATALDSDH